MKPFYVAIYIITQNMHYLAGLPLKQHSEMMLCSPVLCSDCPNQGLVRKARIISFARVTMIDLYDLKVTLIDYIAGAARRLLRGKIWVQWTNGGPKL